jgi:hypothetical protein
VGIENGNHNDEKEFYENSQIGEGNNRLFLSDAIATSIVGHFHRRFIYHRHWEVTRLISEGPSFSLSI